MRKFLSVLLCMFLILGAVSCAPSPEQQSQKSYEEQKALYDDIISRYTDLLTAKHHGEDLTAPNTADMDEREAVIAQALYRIVDKCKDAETAEKQGYGFKDMDGNGTPELILLTQYTNVTAIFTISDNKPILLEAAYEEANYIRFATQNRFRLTRHDITDNIEQITCYTFRVDGDKLAYDAIFGQSSDKTKGEVIESFQMVDGNRIVIDEEAFSAMYREYTKFNQPTYSKLTKLESPFIYFPLKDNVISEDLPIADFSSYAAIRETYKLISTCIDEFDSAEWFFTGAYDNLFAFPNDVSFEYYTRLLYAAYPGIKQTIGYDEIDLNCDGQDELVLLNDDYRIKAIFTQKNGVPVMLDAFVFSYETCWLDDKGFIHVDSEDSNELKYSLYEFTKEGDYNHIYSVTVDNYGRYLTKNGKTEPISYEESMKLYYDEYRCYPEYFAPNEYTRNVTSLSYTPLSEVNEDIIKLAMSETWRKNADLEETTGKDFARGISDVTFENVTDTQLKMNIKYSFKFSYPDPEREHYLLDDITESFLSITVNEADGIFVFDEGGIKGHLEFEKNCLWVIIEESTDERFQVGNHLYRQYSSENIVQ